MAIDTHFDHYAVGHKNGSGGGTTMMYGNVKNADIPADLRVTSITASQGNINSLTGTSQSFNDAEYVYLTTKEGRILKLKGDEIQYTQGQINDLITKKIETDDIESNEANIKSAVINTLNSNNITTEYLTVTRQAHFFELIIDKVKSVGGSLIITGANTVVVYVKAFDSSNNEVAMYNADGTPKSESTINSNAAYYKVYWLAKDEETGKENEDEWYVGDQAYCQSFNVHQGSNFDASNKFYWRKVTGHENKVYMNVKTGEELTGTLQEQADKAAYNYVYISTPTISYIIDDVYTYDQGWTVTPQSLSEVTWTADTSVIDGTTCGTMATKGTTFGIQLTNSAIQDYVPDTFSFTCSKARLGVGFYYEDGKSEWFNAPETGQTSYSFSLTTDYPIEAVIITNADEVEWKLVRGIRLSNSVKASNLSGAASIPSKGDNITQLGHRYNESDSELGQNTDAAKERASAIIIAAYHTPDGGETYDGKTYRGLTPPSYAQYKLINDFALSRFRHTFFDAKGSAFYGDFYAGSGDVISDYQEIDAGTPELFVAYAMDDGQGDADPNNWTKTPQSSTTYDFMGYATATVPPGDTRQHVESQLVFSDYEWTLAPNTTGQQGPQGPQGAAGNDGKDGSGVEYIYIRRQNISSPIPPAITKDEQFVQFGYQPIEGSIKSDVLQFDSGGSITAWKKYPDQVEWYKQKDDEYLLLTKSTYHGSNEPLYPVAGYYPDTDYTDDPQGVTSGYQVEYVRERKYDGETKRWGAFSDAAVWAMYGEVGQQGAQGPQGDTGPQGAQGQNGINSVIYKLLDYNSIAHYGIVLDSNNNSVISLRGYFSYKIAQISNGDVTYLDDTARESYVHNGTTYTLYPYVKIVDTTQVSPKPKWYRLVTDGSDSTICSLDIDDYITLSTGQEKQTFIDTNQTFEIALIPAPIGSTSPLDPSISGDLAIINTMLDKQEIKMTMVSSAQFQIVQGAQASIKALVTSQQSLSEVVIGPQGLQSQVSSISSDLNNLSGEVSDLSDEVYGLQSTVTQMPGEVLSEVVKTYNNAQGLAYSQTVDLSSLDTTTFYPVTVPVPNRRYDIETSSFIEDSIGQEHRIQVRRYLDSSYGVPAYATDTNGFIVCLDFSTVAYGDKNNNIKAWTYDTSLNRNGEPLFINKYEVDYTTTQASTVSGDNIDAKAICSTPIQNKYGCWRYTSISIINQQNYNDEVIYLRGGSKYDISTSFETNLSPHIWTSGYSNTGTYAFNWPVITNWHDLEIANADQMTRSEIKQTVDSIELNVYDTIYQQTGINIESGKINLNANNTNINGGLLNVNTNSGIVWTDSSGTPKINIHAGNITGLPTSVTNNISYNSNDVDMINLSYSPNGSQRTGTITYEWPLQTNYNMLGYLPAGATITISSVAAWCGVKAGRIEYQSTTNYITDTLELLCNDTVIATDTKNITGPFTNVASDGFGAGVTHSTITATVGSGQTNGIWKLRATLNLNNANIYVSYQSGANLYAKWKNGTYTVNFSGASSSYGALEIGTNGIDFVVGGSDHMKYVQNDFSVETTNYSGIKINSGNKGIPMQRYIGGTNYGTQTSNWGAFGTQMRVTTDAATIGNFDYDCYVVNSFHTGSITIASGGSCKGRIIYIMCEKRTTLNTSGTSVINSSGSQATSITLEIGLHVLICYGYNNNKWVWGCTM